MLALGCKLGFQKYFRVIERRWSLSVREIINFLSFHNIILKISDRKQHSQRKILHSGFISPWEDIVVVGNKHILTRRQ